MPTLGSYGAGKQRGRPQAHHMHRRAAHSPPLDPPASRKEKKVAEVLGTDRVVGGWCHPSSIEGEDCEGAPEKEGEMTTPSGIDPQRPRDAAAAGPAPCACARPPPAPPPPPPPLTGPPRNPDPPQNPGPPLPRRSCRRAAPAARAALPPPPAWPRSRAPTNQCRPAPDQHPQRPLLRRSRTPGRCLPPPQRPPPLHCRRRHPAGL